MSPASLAGSAGPSTSCASSIMSPTGSPDRTAARTSVAARSAAAGPRRRHVRPGAELRDPRSATARTSVATRLAAVRTAIAPVPGTPASRRMSVGPDPAVAGSGSLAATAAAAPSASAPSGSGAAAPSPSPFGELGPSAAAGTAPGVIVRPSRSTSSSSIPGSGRPTEPGVAIPSIGVLVDRPGLRQAQPRRCGARSPPGRPSPTVAVAPRRVHSRRPASWYAGARPGARAVRDRSTARRRVRSPGAGRPCRRAPRRRAARDGRHGRRTGQADLEQAGGQLVRVERQLGENAVGQGDGSRAQGRACAVSGTARCDNTRPATRV
jgi:hypothetical protein